MPSLRTGRFIAGLAKSSGEIAQALALRRKVFRGGADDEDLFDADCLHFRVCDRETGRTVCAFRVSIFASGRDVEQSYSAQFYDLSALRSQDGPLAEVGRFCVDPVDNDPDILRAAWGVLTRFVDKHRIAMLFGCSSFQGTDTSTYNPAFALLKYRYLAPDHMAPRVRANSIYPYVSRLAAQKPDLKSAMQVMPPLLRTYLSMGGWVSDHAVVDHDLQTIHVFTGLEIKSIPPARKRILRDLAADQLSDNYQ